MTEDNLQDEIVVNEDFDSEETKEAVYTAADTDLDGDQLVNVEKFENLGNLLKLKASLMQEADDAFIKLQTKEKFNRKDIIKYSNKLHNTTKVVDSLLNKVIEDLFLISDRFAEIENSLFQMIQQQNVLSTVLVDKGTVSKEEIKDTWETKIKPALEEKIAKAKEAQTPTGLVSPQGQAISTNDTP